jgi:multiple sugar transport system ATP-binding protein
LDEAHAKMLGDYEGTGVILGIRPEDLYVAGSPFAPQPVAEIPAALDVLEPMGNEIFVYARSGEHVIVARVSPQRLPEPGQAIRLAMDLTKLHFFDVETEKTLGVEHSAPLAA